MSANIVREGTFKVIDTDTNEVIGSHNEITNAIETLLNERLNNPSRNIQMQPATYRLDLDINSALQASYNEGYAAGIAAQGVPPQTGITIALHGEQQMILHEGDVFNDPGARVTTDVGPGYNWVDLTITGTGDLQEISPDVYEYKVTYTASDDIGNSESEIRTVTINTTDDVLKVVPGGTLTQPDERPDSFQLLINDVSGVPTNNTATSNSFTPTGVDPFGESVISVNIGTYSLNGGAHTAIDGIWTDGDAVELKHPTPGTNSTQTQQTVTIGGVPGVFTSTTQAAAGVETIMADDFESYAPGFEPEGTSSPVGTGIWYGNARAVSISTDISRSGNQSLKFPFYSAAAPVSRWSELRFEFRGAVEYPEVWISYYIYFPDGTEGFQVNNPTLGLVDVKAYAVASNKNNKFIRCWGNIPPRDRVDSHIGGGGSMYGKLSIPGYTNYEAEHFLWRNGTVTLGMGTHLSGKIPISTSATRGTWTHVLHHEKMGSSEGSNDGAVETWLTYDSGGTDYSGFNNLDSYPGDAGTYAKGYTAGYLMGANNDDVLEHTAIYIDEFQVTTTDPR